MYKELSPIKSTVTRLALTVSLLVGGATASGCEASSRVLQGKPRPGVVQEVYFSAFRNDGKNTMPTLRREPSIKGAEVTLEEIRQELKEASEDSKVMQGMRVYGGAYPSGDERGNIATDKNGNKYGAWTAIGYLNDKSFVIKAYVGENGISRGKAIVLEPKSRYKK